MLHLLSELDLAGAGNTVVTVRRIAPHQDVTRPCHAGAHFGTNDRLNVARPGNLPAILVFIGAVAIISLGMIILPVCGSHGAVVLIKRSASEKAKELGLSEDLLMPGDEISALIDKAKQKILFVSRVDHSLYSFSDILEWEWQWVETNGKKSNSYIAFKLNDEKMPLIKVGTLNSDDAERWHTRIGLILNPV